MKIAYVTTYDVLNPSTWSKNQVGMCWAAYYISQSLQAQSISLDYIGSFQKKFALLTRSKWSFYRYLMKKDYYRWAEPLVLKDYGDRIAKKLANSNSDLVFCPESAVPIAYLESKQPIILWTDSTLAALIDSYPYLSNLCNETKRNIYNLERSAFDRCKLVIFPSQWAAQTAIDIYGLNPAKIKVVPWGANLECNFTPSDIYDIIESRTPTPCKLLFFGIDWTRKGGDIAFEVVKELNRMGLNSELTVVGSQPPILNESIPSYVKILGFIDKSTQEGKQKINNLLARSHFLILPSRAETYGHVFCEANSFGVPCVATNIGGIPTIIKDNLNGKTFSLDTSISEYCNYIASLMNNYTEYKELALSSFNEYQSRLNWSVACKNVKELLINILKG